MPLRKKFVAGAASAVIAGALTFAFQAITSFGAARELSTKETLAATATYQLCFVPDGASCQDMLVAAIQGARKSIHVQAYGLTNKAIAAALVDAHARGVAVLVLVDKSQVSEKYTSARFLSNAGISVKVDRKPAIAHNKVMIFDESAVFTGSFNFTTSAETRNAENGLLLSGDQKLANAYLANWQARDRKSEPY